MPTMANFNHEQPACKWDRYGRFYNEDHPSGLIHFDTGEMIIVKRWHRPHERRTNVKYGLRPVRAHDTNVDELNRLHAPDGKRIRKTWLEHMTYMLDLETRQFIALGYPAKNDFDNAIPADIARFSPMAYRAGPGRQWLARATVDWTEPVKLDKDQRGHLREMRKLCMVADRVGALPQNLWHVRMDERGQWLSSSPVPFADALRCEYTDLTPFEKAVVARYGFTRPVAEGKAQRLKVA